MVGQSVESRRWLHANLCIHSPRVRQEVPYSCKQLGCGRRYHSLIWGRFQFAEEYFIRPWCLYRSGCKDRLRRRHRVCAGCSRGCLFSGWCLNRGILLFQQLHGFIEPFPHSGRFRFHPLGRYHVPIWNLARPLQVCKWSCTWNRRHLLHLQPVEWRLKLQMSDAYGAFMRRFRCEPHVL